VQVEIFVDTLHDADPSREKATRLFCAWYRGRVRNRELRNLFESEREAASLQINRGRIWRDSHCGSEDH